MQTSGREEAGATRPFVVCAACVTALLMAAAVALLSPQPAGPAPALGRGRRLNAEAFFPTPLRFGEKVSESENVWFLRHTSMPEAAAPVSSSSFLAPSTSSWVCPDGYPLPDPVVVVGTDGSGTRVVAKLLSLLNFTVLVERAVYGQMDVDGRAAGVHFTAPIAHTLAASGSPDYDLGALPSGVASEGRALVRAFATSMRANACAALGSAAASL